MKIRGIVIDVKTGIVREVESEIDDTIYQKNLIEIAKQEERERVEEMIAERKYKILRAMAIEQLKKEGKLPNNFTDI